MPHHPTIAAKINTISVAMSPYPASFNGNPWLYGGSLASIMAIAVFGLIISGWMAKEIWKNRFIDHPLTLIFAYRFTFFLCGTAAFVRCAPEMIYMTCYGDPNISGRFISAVLSLKRVMDMIALPVVVSWMGSLILSYPYAVLALSTPEARAVRIDPLSFWPRLVRPVVILATVVMIAALMAAAKGYGLRG